VLEMGTNHPGEIAYLTKIAQPTVAAINNAAPAHLEGLGDVKGVSRAKGEIFQGLAPNGVGVVNADDLYAPYWESLIDQQPNRRTIRFGLEQKAEVTAKNIHLDAGSKACFTLITPLGEIEIQLALLGRHNVANALAAAACAIAVGAPLAAIQQGLATATAVKRRLNEYQSYSGAQVIDDSYNANPLSFKAALETLATRAGEKVVVLGDMKELGAGASFYHHELGEIAHQLGIHKLYAYGEFSQAAAEGFGQNARYFSDQNLLITALKSILHPQMTVLVKGSFSTHMDRVVEAVVKG
jgi:UDP-N-acetylmuramoyl-tripeptide--D-alanyl-D-alanine ligase